MSEADADRPSRRQWAIEGRSVDIAGRLRISFQIADQVGERDRPPRTLGAGPVAPAPAEWDVDVVVPVGSEESVWLGLEPIAGDSPSAVRLEVTTQDPIDALTGERWIAELNQSPQNYVVAPPQRSIQGVRSGQDRARPFLGPASAAASRQHAMLRLRIVAILPRDGLARPSRDEPPQRLHGGPPPAVKGGGDDRATVAQRILPDPLGVEMWQVDTQISVRIGLVSRDAYRDITGAEPPWFEADRAYGGWHLP